MKISDRKFLIHSLAAALLTSSCFVSAYNHGDEDEISFDEAQIFFELNDTDGDLGIHAKVDGDGWQKLAIEDPNERRMLGIRLNGRLKKQGLTELFFESTEPDFGDLDPEVFFNRFPEGIYEIEARTLEGEELEGEVFLSHVLPAPSDNVQVSSLFAAADCNGELPEASLPIVISWDPVTTSHPELGVNGNIEVEYYQVVVENEDAGLVLSTMLPPDTTQFTVPDEFIDLADEFKFEILTRATNGNKTAIESCFVVF